MSLGGLDGSEVSNTASFPSIELHGFLYERASFKGEKLLTSIKLKALIVHNYWLTSDRIQETHPNVLLQFKHLFSFLITGAVSTLLYVSLQRDCLQPRRSHLLTLLPQELQVSWTKILKQSSVVYCETRTCDSS